MSSLAPWKHLPNREQFEAAAVAATGLDDFGDPYYREGLDRLLASLLGEIRLNFLGRAVFQRAIANCLEQRLLLQDVRNRDPALLQGELLPPLIVTGLPRSGTTFFHRLLAEDPASFAPPMWRMISPLQPANAAAARLQRIRLKAELVVMRRMAPELDAKHYVRADAPEECIFLTAPSFRSPIFWTQAPVHSYMDWYSDADRTLKYREYRDALRLLQAGAPGRRLILKAPDHLGGLAALFAAIPEATIAVCLRDPGETVPSLASLLMTLHAITTKQLDPRRMMETNIASLVADTRHYLAIRETLADRMVEISYRDLLADPSGAASRFYAKAKIEPNSAVIERFQAFIAANPQRRRGGHEYRAEDFGTAAGAIHGRFGAFSDLARG